MIVGNGVGSLEWGHVEYQEEVHSSVDDHIGLCTVECSWAEIRESECKTQCRAIPSVERSTGYHNDKGHD